MDYVAGLTRELGKAGFTPKRAYHYAEAIAAHMADPERLKAEPHGIIKYGNFGCQFSAAINSDRVRSLSGITLVLDLPALKRAFETETK